MSEKRSYCPTVLLVDDERGFTDYLRKRFHNETSVGVLVACTLEEAGRLLAEPDVSIDAVVTDLFFDWGTDDPDHELYDGLHLLLYSRDERPKARQYVMSFYSEDDQYRARAVQYGLDIRRWFQKEWYDPRVSELCPWQEIERDLRQQWLETRSLSEGVGSAGGVQALRPLPMRTYLQTLGPSREGRFHITKPIEVMCLREDDGTVRASAHALGLLEDARAGSVEEALADLKAIIIDHIELLACKAPAEAVGYAGHVKERLREYVNFDELSHAAEASDAGRADQRGVPSSSPQHARNVGGDLKPESVKQEGRRSKKTGLATRLHGEMERGITPSLESARLAVSLACDVVQYDSRWSDSISFNRETRVAELDLIRAEISKLSTHMIRVPIWPPHELSLLHEACEQMQGHTFQQGELATVAEELRTVICRHMRAR